MTLRNRQWLSAVCVAGLTLLVATAKAETCVTQSQMSADERDALASRAQALALSIQSNDQAVLKALTVPEFSANFSGIGNIVANTAPNLAGATPEVEQVYVLDASDTKRNADGSAPDADFICTLNHGGSEADFSINALPPGRYGFAMVEFVGHSPWVVSLLLRQDGAGAPWKLAGLYPRETSAAGHDGLWYWSQARAMSAKKLLWVAYIDYQEAKDLLQPVAFISSTHLESLRVESTSAIPPDVGDGISSDSPLIIRGADGKQYRFISIGPENSLHKDKLEIVVHRMIDSPTTDLPTIRKGNLDAMSAWLALHPELRESFYGMWVFAEVPGQPPVATEAVMSEIH